jgi:hypothetical protein
MSLDIFFYTGPFGEWIMAESSLRNIPEAIPAEVLLRDNNPLLWCTEAYSGTTPSGDGGPFWRFCAIPCAKRAGQPQRPMLVHWKPLTSLFPEPEPFVFDCTSLDQESEIAWLRQAFAQELKVAEDMFGETPRHRWGVVHWSIT